MSIPETNTLSFTRDVLDSKESVVVDFWAPWCGPCVALAPNLDAAVKETGIKAFKVNTDQHPKLAEMFNVQSLPTLIVFRGGREVGRQVGAPARLTNWLRQYV